MQVKKAMNPRVIVTKPDVTVVEAAKVMSENRIGGLVVMEKKKLIGIMTERDIMKKVVAKSLNAKEMKVSDIMTKKVKTIQVDDTLEEASEIMAENRIKRLPVMDDDELVGIITAQDLISVQPKLIEGLAKLLMFKERKPIAG